MLLDAPLDTPYCIGMKIRGQIVLDPKERLRRLSDVDSATGCWNWNGTKRNGYGRMVIGSRSDKSRKSISAHRYAYMVYRGPIGKLYVCHTCDNRGCVNPDHLFLGTAKDNADDHDSKGRNKLPPRYLGESAPWAKLSNEQVDMIRASSETSAILAAQFGVCDSHIRSIKRGNHFPSPPETAP